jgi:hypothetical protein
MADVTDKAGDWICVRTDEPKWAGMPEWRRSLFIADDGEIFVPARAFGKEDRLMMMATMDNAGFIMQEGHVYLPLSWAERELPEDADLVAGFRAIVARWHQQQNQS